MSHHIMPDRHLSISRSRALELLAIQPNDKQLGDVETDSDILSGENTQVNLSLESGTLNRVRDIVVLNALTIEVEDPLSHRNPRAYLAARDIFVIGTLRIRHVAIIEHRSFYLFSSIQDFHSRLQKIARSQEDGKNE